MKKFSTSYTFGFALTICVICSLSLAAVSEGLSKKKGLNEALDQKKNILKVVGLAVPPELRQRPEDISKFYYDNIEERVVDFQGEIVAGKSPEEIKAGEGLHPLYVYRKDGEVAAYAYPIAGKGLWSTLYGYFAMEPDGATVKGITFYKHNETPGLGGEVEKDWFQDNFKGKKIWDPVKQGLRPVAVVKGKVAEKITPDEQAYYVDGITGATMTSSGVTALLDHWARAYDPFFKQIREGG